MNKSIEKFDDKIVNYTCTCKQNFYTNQKLLYVLPCCHIIHETCFNKFILDVQYENLYKNDKISISLRNTLYKEKTNVFAYYIITSILLNDYTKFLKWCNINNFTMIKFNKTPRTLESFYLFIKKYYTNSLYITSLKCVEKMNKLIMNRENNTFLKKSLRMTILELN